MSISEIKYFQTCDAISVETSEELRFPSFFVVRVHTNATGGQVIGLFRETIVVRHDQLNQRKDRQENSVTSAGHQDLSNHVSCYFILLCFYLRI